jgi:hypothetical protein
VYLKNGATCRVRDRLPCVDSVDAEAVVPLPDAEGQCTGYAWTYDAQGQIEPAVQVSCQLVRQPAGAGHVLEDAPRTATSDGNGLVTFPNLWIGATYRFWRTGSPAGRRIAVDAADVAPDGTYKLPDILG